ncbi:tRNA isopentenyl-2-thiomethyl-A-37 hydroxylase MiaE [Psychrobium sp. 1_MG-2023]|uniref:tRNA isopentenyl-2-thiomethyl-A-37 hydroxylase MiaE n=1 Tax=Psychrobium sp. 1_MG-2023 TaxID=3062624 RepID=UPI002687E89E|nr:tRNA isopentenyl-2-thiomethyl-A-37 hydroxylase MiaE [Psychrobium sp. 1_MG-2023]MDP2561434.1 tRNA isopentenyl-2-thiomethyl-A-37 hydroxylase MiaE [Psychrobium sp. 1_MG-2023]
MTTETLLEPILNFLQCETPDEWITEAKKAENLPVLLVDHLMCELKAGQTAMLLIRKYAVDKESGQALMKWFEPYEKYVYKKQGTMAQLTSNSHLAKEIKPRDDSPYGQELVDKMVLLIKEELHHFYQVLEIMENRDIPYQNIRAGRYAKGLMKHVRTYEPCTLVDKLIIGAYIEARSCERFAKLAPHLEPDLNKFYISLLRSEARHYQDYLKLAQMISDEDITERIKHFGLVEAELISSNDDDFKFHSGKPILIS